MTTTPSNAVQRGIEHADAPLSYDGDHCQNCGSETLALPHRPNDPRRRVVFPGREPNVEAGPSADEVPFVVCGACEDAWDELHAESTDEYFAGRDTPPLLAPYAAADDTDRVIIRDADPSGAISSWTPDWWEGMIEVMHDTTHDDDSVHVYIAECEHESCYPATLDGFHADYALWVQNGGVR